FSDFNPIQHDLKATFSAAASGFELERLVLSTGASRISARARLSDYSNPAVQGTYQGFLSVQELRSILKQPSLPAGLNAVTGAVPTMHLEREPVSGSVDADAEATWHGSMQGLRLRSDATIAATAAVPPSVPNVDAQSIPVNATVHLTYDAAQNVISLNQTYLRTP